MPHNKRDKIAWALLFLLFNFVCFIFQCDFFFGILLQDILSLCLQFLSFQIKGINWRKTSSIVWLLISLFLFHATHHIVNLFPFFSNFSSTTNSLLEYYIHNNYNRRRLKLNKMFFYNLHTMAITLIQKDFSCQNVCTTTRKFSNFFVLIPSFSPLWSFLLHE